MPDSRGISEANIWNVRQHLVRAKRRLARTAKEIVQMEQILSYHDNSPNNKCWHCKSTNPYTTDLEMCEIANTDYPFPCSEFERG